MKKIYLSLLGMTLAVSAVNAQTGKVKGNLNSIPFASSAKLIAPTHSNVLTLDTLAPASNSDTCFTNNIASALTLYILDNDATIDSGFVAGNNYYGDLEKAQRYNASGNVSVTGCLAAIHYEGTASASATSIKVYGVNPTTMAPSTALGTSQTIAVNALTNDGFNAYTFSTPVAVGNVPFFVSYVLPTGASDMLGVFHTKFDCVSSDSLAWEKWDVGTWHSFVNPSNWGINVDLALYPIVDIPAAVGIVENSISKNGLTLYAAYPSPANNELSINYGLNNGGSSEINIMDATGKVVKTYSNKGLVSGKQTQIVDLSSFASGIYMYSVSANGTKLFSKFTVVK